jgi:hypothetical protein
MMMIMMMMMMMMMMMITMTRMTTMMMMLMMLMLMTMMMLITMMTMRMMMLMMMMMQRLWSPTRERLACLRPLFSMKMWTRLPWKPWMLTCCLKLASKTHYVATPLASLQEVELD